MGRLPPGVCFPLVNRAAAALSFPPTKTLRPTFWSQVGGVPGDCLLPLTFSGVPHPLASFLAFWVSLLVMASFLGNPICGLWGQHFLLSDLGPDSSLNLLSWVFSKMKRPEWPEATPAVSPRLDGESWQFFPSSLMLGGDLQDVWGTASHSSFGGGGI